MCKIPRLFELINERKITAKKLSEVINVSTGNISDWKSGRSTPSSEKIILLAQFFNVSTDYLLGLTEEQQSLSPKLSEDKQRLLKMYDLLNDLEKAEILGELKGMTRGRAESKNAETA